MNWNDVDPQWAWSEYESSAEAPWDLAAASHLMRRAGFGASRSELDELVQRSPAEVVAELTELAPPPADFERDIEQLARTVLATGDPLNLAPLWTYRILHTPNPLREKLTLFWHGHFATSAEKVQDVESMYRQNELLRSEAMGDFKKLVHGISKDPAMLVYLDSATNRKSHPNENYARELMELFCLGEGNYTEQDIRELARCFTGWEIRRDKYRFNRYQHDSGSKAFLGREGKFTGEDGVDIVLDQDPLPYFICGKLFQFFVCDEPAPTRELLEPLAREFREGDLQIQPLIRRMLGSRLFFSSHARGRKIKSPVELLTGLLRSLEGSSNFYDVSREFAELGQALFYPPNVKGWEGGRAWINSSTLLGRANAVRQLLSHPKTRFGGGSLAEYLARQGVDNEADGVAWLLDLLVAVPVPSSVREELVQLVQRPDGDLDQRYRQVLHAIGALPELQLG